MKIQIDTEYIRLDDLLKISNLVSSGGMAKHIIQDGQVLVDKEVDTARGRKIYPGSVVELGDTQILLTRE